MVDARPDVLDPGFHCARTHWIRGFMTFQLVRRIRTVMLMVTACPESGALGRAARETTWPLRTLAVAKRARRGRPAGSEPVQWPGLPRDETRTFTLTGPQPPKRTPVTHLKTPAGVPMVAYSDHVSVTD